MGSIKEEHLALSSGIGLAGFAIINFYENEEDVFDIYDEELFKLILKPNKRTAIHRYLEGLQDFSEDINNFIKNVDDLEFIFSFINRTLLEVNLTPELKYPDFANCSDEFHYECRCREIFKQWEKYAIENSSHIDNLIIRSAFQIIFQDRKFLHDFHLKLATFTETYINDIQNEHSNFITSKNRVKRSHFPKWLTNAVFYRDKGTCSLCRCDLSNLLRTTNTIHIDHIIPLKIFGSNDSTNFQLLCEKCNTSKGARSTTTSSMNIPFWN